MIGEGGTRPAGWIYVTSHRLMPNYTKIGYSKWHPFKACVGYPNGYKRLHHLEFSLRAFGFGELDKWSSEYHPNAEGIEKIIHARLSHLRRNDVGKAKEIFDISSDEAKAIVEEYI